MIPMRALYAQFARPSGPLGGLVGWILANRPSNRARARWTLSLLGLEAGDTLLDVGCGPGVALQMALATAKPFKVTGLDHSATVLGQAKGRLSARRYTSRVELIHGSLDDPRLVDRRFRKICSMNVIQFFPDRSAALVKMAAMLEPGGRLAVTYQPRGPSPTREAAIAMSDAFTAAFAQIGLINVRRELLELRPAPAVCVLGERST
jgi:ubiquinone/menaquinone biosynthesis C-methylase UbiE